MSPDDPFPPDHMFCPWCGYCLEEAQVTPRGAALLLHCPSCKCSTFVDEQTMLFNAFHHKGSPLVDRKRMWQYEPPAPEGSKSLLDWGEDGLYDDARAVHLHGRCHAASDGECSWRECPQLKNYKTHCPLDKKTGDED